MQSHLRSVWSDEPRASPKQFDWAPQRSRLSYLSAGASLVVGAALVYVYFVGVSWLSAAEVTVSIAAMAVLCAKRFRAQR